MSVLINAVGCRESNGDIDTYIDRHGVADLATVQTLLPPSRSMSRVVTSRQFHGSLDNALEELVAELA